MFQLYSAILRQLFNLSKLLHCSFNVIKMNISHVEIFQCFHFLSSTHLKDIYLRASFVTFSCNAFLL
jgi:hypothetical protein